MQLVGIQVPDFRVLNDINLTFDKNFSPNIFPLGSQNGGGKSTLLQLIFILLHCCVNNERKSFIKNMLQGFHIDNKDNKRVLAIIDIWDGEKTVTLEFVSYKDGYIKELLSASDSKDTDDYSFPRFSASAKLEEVKNKIATTEEEIQILNKTINKLENTKMIESSDDRRYRLLELMEELQGKIKISRRMLSRTSNISIDELQEEVQERLAIFKLNIEEFDEEFKQLKRMSQIVEKYLQSANLLYICNYSSAGQNIEEEVLLCHIDNLEMTKADSFLKELSQKVFLAAPSTQVFLFLSQESKKLLFRVDRERHGYSSALEIAKAKLPGFFTYDFATVDLLIASVKAARDEDFIEAIETGEYGNSYKKLIKDINSIIFPKKVSPVKDLAGMTFKLERDGNEIRLSPEDLSHGELKRLSIYMWIKYSKIVNAIVLMDEIEIALHPDWQYQIISDIYQWSPTNQYILATHSYALCEALTPANVKEIEPKLIKSENKN